MKTRTVLAVLFALVVLAGICEARVLNPSLGRWLRRDPVGLVEGDMSLYSYAGSQPLWHVDPMGLVTVLCNGEAGMQNQALMNPLDRTAPECFAYAPGETYRGINLRCFCQCAGDDPWSSYVRSCLYILRQCGYETGNAHSLCYGWADDTVGQRPTAQLAFCVAHCAWYLPDPINPVIPKIIPWIPRLAPNPLIPKWGFQLY